MIAATDRTQHWVMLSLGTARVLLRQVEMQLLQPSSNIIDDTTMPPPAIGGIRVSSAIWPVYHLQADFSANSKQMPQARPMCAIFRNAEDCFGLAVDDADILEMASDSILPLPAYARYPSVAATGVFIKDGHPVFATDSATLHGYLSGLYDSRGSGRALEHAS